MKTEAKIPGRRVSSVEMSFETADGGPARHQVTAQGIDYPVELS